MYTDRAGAVAAVAAAEAVGRPEESKGTGHRQLGKLSGATASPDVKLIRGYFESMQQARRAGDWMAYGEAEEKMGKLLERYNK
jgi:hypothetical protein